MSKIKTYILTKSYILKAGILSVINEIPEINFINFDYNENIAGLIKDNAEALFITDDFYYKQISDNVNNVSKLNLINVTVNNIANDENAVNLTENTKSDIIDLINNFISLRFEPTSNTKSNELSNREISIVRCIAKGMTNKEIADKLFISMHTVITHRKNITKKLGIKSISGITVYAILNNIVDINEI